ncbi:MAG: tetratricopeptide repeat protein [Planctomycetaceae bacterium]|jgi:tetratricopeptide (TPR) repeat protein|nr:tetratricopeptide repeat protein [Planctomycetaceae bacterium]
MTKYIQQNVSWLTIFSCLILGAFSLAVEEATSQSTSLLAPGTIPAEKAKMIGYVENHITNKFVPMLRRTVEWSNIKKNNKNQYTITYKCEAIALNNNECLIYCWDFTFDEVGNFVKYDKVAGFPKRPAKPFVKIAPKNDDKNTTQKTTLKSDAPEIKITAADFTEGANAYKKATELVEKGDYADAEIQFKEAFKKNPNNYMALLELGNTQFKQQLNDDAQKTFIKCIEMRPKDYRPLEALGLIAQAEGNEDKMIEWWKKSIELNKQAYTALKGLGQYYAEKNDEKNASLYYRIYLQSKPQDTEIKKALEQLKNKNTN